MPLLEFNALPESAPSMPTSSVSTPAGHNAAHWNLAELQLAREGQPVRPTSASVTDSMGGKNATERIPGPRFIAIASGHSHSLALDRAGNVWAWGCNAHGQAIQGLRQHVLAARQVLLNPRVPPDDRCVRRPRPPRLLLL